MPGTGTFLELSEVRLFCLHGRLYVGYHPMTEDNSHDGKCYLVQSRVPR